MLTVQGSRTGAARWMRRGALVTAAVLFAALFFGAAAAAQDADPMINVVLNGEIMGNGFTPDASATFRVYAAPGGTLLYSGSTSTENGFFSIDTTPFGVDFAPGMFVSVTDEATGRVREVTLVAVTFDYINPTTGIARGTAPPGSHVLVYAPPFDQEQDPVEATTQPDGTWVADYHAAGLPLGNGGSVNVDDDDGDQTSVYKYEPGLDVTTGWDFQRFNLGVDGSWFTPNASVDVSIVSPAGQTLWTATFPTDETGSFGHCCVVPELTRVEIVDGTRVVATDPATTISLSLTVVPLSIDLVDPVTDTVAGTGPPGAEVVVTLDDTDLPQLVVPADGHWSVHAGVDVTWTMAVEAAVRFAYGSLRTMASPPTIQAGLTDGVVRGLWFTLNAPIDVEIRDAAGGTLWTTVVTSAIRGFEVSPPFSLEPGMTVRVTDTATGMVKELTIVPLAIDVVDPAANVVAGTARPNTTVALFVAFPGEGGGQLAEGVPVDATGHWSYTTSGDVDLKADTVVAAAVWDDELDATTVQKTATPGAIADLKADVVALPLPAAQAAALTTKLDDALAKLNAGNTTAALGNLGAFVQKVQALVQSHRLSASAGADLIRAAESIEAAVRAAS